MTMKRRQEDVLDTSKNYNRCSFCQFWAPPHNLGQNRVIMGTEYSILQLKKLKILFYLLNPQDF